MKRKPKIILALVISLLTIALAPVIIGYRAVNAAADETLARTSKAALLMDANTGTVVFQKNEKDRLPIASMVKIMTLSLALDEIEKREIPFDTLVTASENAASMGGSQAFLDAGAEYKLDELIKSIIVASANDSCVAVAEYLFGSVDAFVTEMNARADRLGLTDTAFVNCTGLPKDGQYSCAADVSVMFRDLMRHDKFYEHAKVWMYDIEHPSGRTTQLTNTNKLVRFYNGCDAGKTGYTDAARSCITVTAKRGDTRLVCVSIGAENSKTRNKEVSDMLNYGFANYKTVFAVHKGDELGEFAVSNGKTERVSVIAASDCSIFVKNGDGCEITLEPSIGELYAPVKTGDIVGKITVKVNGETYAEVDAEAAAGCEKKGYGDIIKDFIHEW